MYMCSEGTPVDPEELKKAVFVEPIPIVDFDPIIQKTHAKIEDTKKKSVSRKSVNKRKRAKKNARFFARPGAIRFRQTIRSTGINLWNRKTEIAIGMATGAGVRYAFAAAAVAVAAPVSTGLIVGGIAGGAVAGYAKARYFSSRTNRVFTRQDALKAAFKGAAFAFGGQVVGYAVASLVPAEWFHAVAPPKETITVQNPSPIPSKIVPAPAPSAPVMPVPAPHAAAPSLPVTPAPAPSAPIVTPSPTNPVTIKPLPSAAGDLRTDILNHLNNGEFDRMPGHLREQLKAALATPGHEDWRHVMARLADAGYYDFNGRGGAPHDLATRKLGARFYGLAQRVATAHHVHGFMARSVRKSVIWLSKLSRFKAEVSV